MGSVGPARRRPRRGSRSPAWHLAGGCRVERAEGYDHTRPGSSGRVVRGRGGGARGGRHRRWRQPCSQSSSRSTPTLGPTDPRRHPRVLRHHLQARSWCSGVFKRQGDERLLTVRGRRQMSDEERKRTMPTLVRTTSKDPERSCPSACSVGRRMAWCRWRRVAGTASVRVRGVSVQHDPPKDNGECPICRKEVSMDSLRRVTRR